MTMKQGSRCLQRRDTVQHRWAPTEPVFLFAQGKCSELFASVSDNTDVAKLMAMAMQVNRESAYGGRD